MSAHMTSPRERRRASTKRSFSAVVVTALALALAACTPRPDTGADTLKDFLDALAAGELDTAAELTDQDSDAAADLRAATEGIRAQGLNYEVEELSGDGSQSSATVAMNWQLPDARSWQYRTTFTLTKSETGDQDWALRWSPAALHPQLGRNQHPELRTIPAPRPSVVGSDGAALLEPGIVHRVVLDRDAVPNVQSAINRAATIINNSAAPGSASAPGQGSDSGEITATESAAPGGAEFPTVDARALGRQAAGGRGNFSIAVLPATAPESLKQQLAEVSGISVNDEAAMVRPDPRFAPDLMSRIERLIGDENQGVDGWQIVAANNDGAAFGTLHSVAPEVAPAIQASVSKKAQDAAQRAVDTRQDAQAMMVAIQPSSGKILAVAQTRQADREGPLALSGQYPPGSTYKIVTAAAGIARQGLSAGATVPCPAQMEIGTRIVTNYNGMGVGNTSLQDAFARSCNTTFADIAYRLEPGQFQQESKQFGIGVNYEIPGLETITGAVSDGTDPVERTDAGYGQGEDLASPFGMALVAATVAAGRTPTPQLVASAKTVQSDPAEPLPPEVLDNLRPLMRAVVTSGTATAISGRGEIYGKTGEAEVAGGSHAWFVGYRDDLAFATLIVKGGGSEHAVAITDTFFAQMDEG